MQLTSVYNIIHFYDNSTTKWHMIYLPLFVSIYINKVQTSLADLHHELLCNGLEQNKYASFQYCERFWESYKHWELKKMALIQYINL